MCFFDTAIIPTLPKAVNIKILLTMKESSYLDSFDFCCKLFVNTPVFQSDFKSRSHCSEPVLTRVFCTRRGLGWELQQAENHQPPGRKVDGFSCLWVQRHSLPVCICIYTSIACSVVKLIMSCLYKLRCKQCICGHKMQKPLKSAGAE